MSKTEKKNMFGAPEIQNRKARHSYNILEKFEVGVMLCGTEVKSIRMGRVNMVDSFVEVTKDSEIWVNNLQIEVFDFGNIHNHRPTQKRKLLAHRHEITKMKKSVELKGYTIIPLRLYFTEKGMVKIEIAICTGKDNQDKRQDLIAKTQKREIDRVLKNVRRG
jgi:SsrA-binding protein